MVRSLETYSLNYEGIKSLKRPVFSIKIQSVIRNLPIKKNSGPDGFTSTFY